MPDILALLTCLTLQLDNTSLKQLGCIIQGMFAMSGRVTMLGISRWTGRLAFLALSLVGLEKRESYPLRIEQIIKSADESNINTTTPPTVKKRKRGRPKGSKNKDKSQCHVILFSTDLTLGAEKLVELYSLRFQIEFNFRDAKQFWGWEDFMNVSQTGVTNMVNLAFFMVNFSRKTLEYFGRSNSLHNLSILDLKAFYRGARYLDELIKLLPQKPEPILISRILNRVVNIGAIHPISLSNISIK